MAKVRIVYKPDKSVVILHPAKGSRKSGETVNQWYSRIFAKMMEVPELSGLPYDDIDESELPQTRTDRDAWEGEKGKKISINKEKAKKIKADRDREIAIIAKMRELAEKALDEEG